MQKTSDSIADSQITTEQTPDQHNPKDAPDSEADDEQEGFFCASMFNVDEEPEEAIFDLGKGTSHSIKLKIQSVHAENKFVEEFVPRVVWPSAAALCDHLLNRVDLLPTVDGNRPLRTLELGSGTGVCGLGLALSGLCRPCVLTDGNKESQELLRTNIELNNLTSDQCSVSGLQWGDMAAAQALVAEHGGQLFDVVIGTDVVYEPQSVLPLFETTLACLVPGGTLILANHTHRYAGLEHAVVDAAEKLAFTTVSTHSISCDEGQIDVAVYKCP